MAEYDVLIKNGTIVDGLRMPAYRGISVSGVARLPPWAMSAVMPAASLTPPA